MFTFKKNPTDFLRDEAEYRLAVLITQCNPHAESYSYLKKHGFGYEDQACGWHWDKGKLAELNGTELIALAQEHILEPGEMEHGLDDDGMYSVRQRAIVRAIIDLQAQQGFNHGYDEGYRRAARRAIENIKQWIASRAIHFVFSPASIVPAMQAELKLEEIMED